MTAGERVRMLREGRGLTLGALAQAANVSLSAVWMVEQGHRRVTYEVSRSLGAALGVSGELLYQDMAAWRAARPPKRVAGRRLARMRKAAGGKGGERKKVEG